MPSVRGRTIYQGWEILELKPTFYGHGLDLRTHLSQGCLRSKAGFLRSIPMVVLLNPEDCILLGTRQESAEEDEKSKIYDALGSERLSGKALSVKTGIPYSTVMKRLNALKLENKVDCEKGDGKGSVLLWFQIEVGSSNKPQVDEAS